jgi:hypothetical protein
MVYPIVIGSIFQVKTTEQKKKRIKMENKLNSIESNYFLKHLWDQRYISGEEKEKKREEQQQYTIKGNKNQIQLCSTLLI